MAKGVTDFLKKGYEAINPAAMVGKLAKDAKDSLLPKPPPLPGVPDPIARQTQGIGEMSSLLDRVGVKRSRKLQDSSMTMGRKPLGGR